MRDKFTFFENFKETADKLPDDFRLKFYDGLTDYVFKGIEPIDPVISALVNALKPSLDKTDNRGGPRENSGRPKKNIDILENQKKSKIIKNNQNVSNDNQNNQSFQESKKVENKKIEDKKVEDNIISLDKSSEINLNNRAKEKKYAFEGKVIKLNQKDFDNWQKAYPDLNLYGELLRRDEWLAEQPPNIQKQWYMSTGQFFLKQNEFRKRQNAELDEKMGETKSSSVFDEHEVEHNLDWI